MRKIFTLLLISFFAVNTLFCQFTFNEHDPIQNWKFYYDINQDPLGNIWASAEDGNVLMYDGSVWTAFNPAGFETENMRVIAATSENDIWVGTQNQGLLHYDGSIWTEFNTGNSNLPHNRVRAITIADNGVVWIGTSSGFAIVVDGVMSAFTSSNSDLPDGVVSDIKIDGNGSAWMANDNYMVRITDGIFTNWFADDVTGYFNTEIETFDFASNGDVYAGTLAGLIKFDGSTWSTTQYLDFSSTQYLVQSMAIDDQDRLWFATINFGVYIHDITTNTLIGAFESDGFAIPSGQLTDIFVADDSAVWVGGIGGGLSEITDVLALQPLAVSAQQLDLACNEDSNGSISLTVSGGVPPYSFMWSDNTLEGDMLTGLTAGVYMVTVTDSETFSFEETITIIEPDALSATVVSSPETDTNSDGTISIVVEGGVPPYTYLWNDGQTAATLTTLGAGDYTVTVTDANECTLEGAGFVDMITAVNSLANDIEVNITPNPVVEILNLNIEGNFDVLRFDVISIDGSVLLSNAIASEGLFSADVSSLTTGLYIVRLLDNEGGVYVDKILVR